MPIWVYNSHVARSPTTADVFNAVAETRRRDILGLLAQRGAQPVGALVADLKLPQPAVSKHLAVLRRVGLVGVSRLGRQRVYRLNAEGLKPVHDWSSAFEQFWTHQLLRIKERAEREPGIDVSPAPPTFSHPSPQTPETPPC